MRGFLGDMESQLDALWATYSGTKQSGAFQLMNGLIHEPKGLKILGDIISTGNATQNQPLTNGYMDGMKKLSDNFDAFFKLYLKESVKGDHSVIRKEVAFLREQLKTKSIALENKIAEYKLLQNKYDELMNMKNLQKKVKEMQQELTKLRKKK